MKKIKLLFNYFFITTVLTFSFIYPGYTVSLEKGNELFLKNCIICHLDGNNIIIPEKNLKKDSLEENGMNSINAISYQILNGKNGMPAFGGRLTESEIEKIAIYVLEESRTNFSSETKIN